MTNKKPYKIVDKELWNEIVEMNFEKTYKYDEKEQKYYTTTWPELTVLKYALGQYHQYESFPTKEECLNNIESILETDLDNWLNDEEFVANFKDTPADLYYKEIITRILGLNKKIKY